MDSKTEKYIKNLKRIESVMEGQNRLKIHNDCITERIANLNNQINTLKTNANLEFDQTNLGKDITRSEIELICLEK